MYDLDSPENFDDSNVTDEEVAWRGNSLDEIYRGISSWDLPHLAPIAAAPNHAVLYKLPWNPESTEPPVPMKNPSKWDADHVKLPNSHRNTIMVKEEVSIFNSVFNALMRVCD